MATLANIIQEAKDQRNSNWVIDAINQGYLDEHDEFKRKTSFAPSSLFYGSGACPKRWVIAFNGAIHKATMSPSSKAKMEQGRLSHERIQRALIKSNLVITTEDEIRVDYPPIHGYTDGIAYHNEEQVVIEIKTVSSQSFLYTKNTRKPTKYHLNQLLFYMYLKGIEKGILLYENRDTLDLMALPVFMTDETYRQMGAVVEWCIDVYDTYKEKELPKRGFRRGSKVCSMCPVEAQCDKEEGTLALPKLPI